MTWGQIKYWAFAEQTFATVSNVFETDEPGRRGRRIKKRAVDFAYKNAEGKRVQDREDVPFSRTYEAGQEIEIRYFPDKDRSARIVGEDSMFGPIVFFGSLVAGLIGIVMLAREANAPIRR